MNKKSVAIVQARMGSTRLPGKVMKLLAGKTVLAHVIERIRACPLLNEVVVATTTLPKDDIIVSESLRHGAKIFRGSEQDVLSRYFGAAQEYGAEIVIRITSDCPLLDSEILTQMTALFIEKRSKGEAIDYLSNTLELTFPRGLDVEIFTFTALARAFEEASDPYDREHVTPYVYHHPELFNLMNFANSSNQSQHRWTLDTVEDFELISEIYQRLYADGEMFNTAAVMHLFGKNPQLELINAHVKQKAG